MCVCVCVCVCVCMFETGSPGWGAVVPSWLTAALTSRVQEILLPQPLQVAGNIGVCYHAWLIFVFLVEMEFRHVG